MILSRRALIELIRRQIYGEQPTDDASITVGLVNTWLPQGIAAAAKQNYKESYQIEGVGYVNNSFYTTFKGLSCTLFENGIWQIELPQIPIGIGRNEGVSTLRLKDTASTVSLPCIPLSASQVGYYERMRPIPGKVLYYSEGGALYMVTAILLNTYSASVTMISGGLSSDLDSDVNIPDDYLPIAIEYIKQQLLLEQSRPKDKQNDGVDNA